MGCIPIFIYIHLFQNYKNNAKKDELISYYKLLLIRGENFKKIQVGMTREQVIQVAGLPHYIWRSGPWEIWIYDEMIPDIENIQRRLIRFKDDLVNEKEDFDKEYEQILRKEIQYYNDR